MRVGAESSPVRLLQVTDPHLFGDEAQKIYGGRKQNLNGDAKGRWVSVYRLRSRAAAITWANRNNVRLAEAELPADKPAVQVELLTDH